MTCSRIHPRCGTSFLLIAVIVSIIIFSPVKTLIAGESFMLQVAARIILIPVVIGISYEIIRLSTRSGKIGFCIIAPFLTLQYLTTREPDIKQAEIALISLDTAMKGAILS